jgi:hypothetical protein
VSEKIDLTKAQPTAAKESQFDDRLFNKDAGIGSGFGAADSYSIYDKKLFAGSTESVYRPKKTAGDAGDVYDKMVASRAVHQGFSGTDADASGAASSGPVKFEKEDVFGGLEDFIWAARNARQTPLKRERARRGRGACTRPEQASVTTWTADDASGSRRRSGRGGSRLDSNDLVLSRILFHGHAWETRII